MLPKKALKAYAEGGVATLGVRTINYLYREIPFLPPRYVEYNKVYVPEWELIGAEDRPGYESGIIEGMKRTIEKDDKVLILGGGVGVTAVTAARLCRNPSNVEVYEGAEGKVDQIKLTTKTNNVEGVVIHHAVVGPEIDVWGETQSAERIEAEELPECDVLEMDVEGSEIEILEDMTIRPRVIIVESHGMNGAPTERVRELLNELSYEIVESSWAEDIPHAKENDVRVLTAVREN